MKACRTCGRQQHDGICDMATLDDGHIVHASRIQKVNGVEMVDGVRVKNRWIKPEKLGSKLKRRVGRS